MAAGLNEAAGVRSLLDPLLRPPCRNAVQRETSTDRSKTATVSGGGESRVGAILDCLPAEYVVFHDLRIPGSAVTVDHLVVGPGGVYVVGAREYPHAVTFGLGADADSIWTGGQRIDVDSVAQTVAEVERLVGVRVRPVMCIVAPMLPGPVVEVDGLVVCHPNRVITEVTRSFGRKVDVAKIARRVGEVFDAEPQDRSDVAALGSRCSGAAASVEAAVVPAPDRRGAGRRRADLLPRAL